MSRVARRASGPLRGCVRVPGDKSISHRAVLFAAMAEGSSRLVGVLDSQDVRSTIDAVGALGAGVEIEDAGPRGLDVVVRGWGSGGPSRPRRSIDCGNSGTTARLLMGVLAGWDVPVTLTGDASLARRPMRRVTAPLASMGAFFEASEGGTLPIVMRGGGLRPLDATLDVASAQVKSALLLAGLRAPGRTLVREPAPSRDHTERMLPAFGVPVGRRIEANEAWVTGPVVPEAADVVVPGDPSSAAFLACAAAMVPGSDVMLEEVALNPTRTGFVRVLERMGADVAVTATGASGSEPMGTLRVRGTAALSGCVVTPGEVPSLIDEIPVLAVLATAAAGTTRFDGIEELRVKESDRLAAITQGLQALGARARSGADWLEVDGAVKLTTAELDSLGDHRLAMAWAVAALGSSGDVRIARWEAVDVSYPTFAEDLASLL